jgi:hypothetical protein
MSFYKFSITINCLIKETLIFMGECNLEWQSLLKNGKEGFLGGKFYGNLDASALHFRPLNVTFLGRLFIISIKENR